MRKFRLNMAALLAGIVGTAGLATWLFTEGMWAPGCIALIAMISSLAALWSLQSRLIHTMSSFVKALEMHDTTMRVETSGDAELREMSKAMNTISKLYHANLRELETRKLYYDRILKIMTHEMRNGITPLIAISADMRENPERYSGERLVEVASLFNTQADGIKHFLDSYYNLTHLPEPQIEEVRAGDYFSGVRKLVRSEVERRGLPPDIISYTLAEDMLLEIDSSLMNQVLLNIIRNALDAVAGLPKGRVEVVLTVSDRHPYLTVADNGSGISPEVMMNLFQPFFTTKKGGSGVGLSLSRQIVRRHGGDLWLMNRHGHGTTVVITL